MHPSRIAELLDPFLGPPEAPRLAPETYDRISTYIDLLQRWNARVNLTAIRHEEEIVTRHFGESLFTARQLFPLGKEQTGDREQAVDNRQTADHQQTGDKQTGVPHFSPKLREVGIANAATELPRTRLADLGSGAGFPGIPIKLWVPEISLTLIESNHKKATFLREVTRVLTLTNVNIQTARAESLAHPHFDVVTLRAVERFDSILPIAAGLLAEGGRLALLIGRSQLSQAHSTLPALNWHSPLPIPHSQSRILAIATLGQESR